MPGFWPEREVKLQRNLNFTRESLSVAVTASTMPRVTTRPPWMAAWTFPRSRIFWSVAASGMESDTSCSQRPAPLTSKARRTGSRPFFSVSDKGSTLSTRSTQWRGVSERPVMPLA